MIYIYIINTNIFYYNFVIIIKASLFIILFYVFIHVFYVDYKKKNNIYIIYKCNYVSNKNKK